MFEDNHLKQSIMYSHTNVIQVSILKKKIVIIEQHILNLLLTFKIKIHFGYIIIGTLKFKFDIFNKLL